MTDHALPADTRVRLRKVNSVESPRDHVCGLSGYGQQAEDWCPACVWNAGYWAGVNAQYALALDRLDALEAAERELRCEWWLGHGCGIGPLYGDDGEMQCNALTCRKDFQRDPLDALRAHVHERRLALALEAMTKGPGREARPQGEQ